MKYLRAFQKTFRREIETTIKALMITAIIVVIITAIVMAMIYLDKIGIDLLFLVKGIEIVSKSILLMWNQETKVKIKSL